MSAAHGRLLPLRLDDVGLAVDGHRLLQGITATIAAPGVTVVLGPNGAGKTLLMRLCRGLLRPSGGRIRWHDTRPGDAGTRVGYVPQLPAMLRRSVRANLAYALDRAGTARAERQERIAEGLCLAGLDGRGEASARYLSGGECQRLAIARAWVQRPAALMLDEPSAHLDPTAVATIERTIASIRDQGTKVILTTHDLHQARRLADEVLFIHAGRLLEQTPAASFFDSPATAEAHTFISGELLAA